MQLTFRCYKGGLLDVDHFFNWMLNNLAECVPDALPLSLTVLYNYWADMTKSLPWSRRAAVSCLQRLDEVR